MGKQKPFFLVLFACIGIFSLISLFNIHTCLAQGGWPAYTQNVLMDPIMQYIQSASLPGSVMVSGCWGYPWFAVPGGANYPSTAWSQQNYYMYYPPIGWFDYYFYPFWNIYNVADPLRDYPNYSVLTKNPGTGIKLPLDMLLQCTDPICFYLGTGIHYYSGAITSPFAMLQGNNPSLDPILLRYLSLMGLFDYNIPSRLVSLPVPSL